MSRLRFSALFIACGFALGLMIALLPWWRNHGYLRDLYDYGLVIAANGHLNLGEKPYVNFATPIQAGFLGLNWLIERAGGGTYAALTWGGAGLIVIMNLGLTLLLARRWSWWAALLLGTVVTVSVASQHTILWHNALGVFGLALVAWASACAPAWRRETWGWHLVVVTGLFLGGINKLNFHLVGVAVALAWALRAGLLRRAGWGGVSCTGLGILTAGLLIPIGTEMVWTGATFGAWWHNVIGLAGSSRLGIIRDMLGSNFLIEPFHNYYGPLLVPQVGLVGIVLLLAVLIGCRPNDQAGGARLDRWLHAAAVMLTGFAAVVLLATNYEIVCLAGGAWLVLVVSLWLGFAPVARHAYFIGGLILPAVVLGVSAWWSAWQGQRSQFGYSSEARADYLPAASIGAKFSGLTGLSLPSDSVKSFRILDQALPDPDKNGHRQVFYGLGMEWAERYLPGLPRPGKPLWVHWGTSYGPEALEALRRDLQVNEGYEVVISTVARDDWPEPVGDLLRKNYTPGLIGPTVKSWTRADRYADLGDAFEALDKLGGNVAGHVLHFDSYPLRFRKLSDGRFAMGTTRTDGAVLLTAATNDLRGVVVLERLPGAGNQAVSAIVKAVVHGATPENSRWSARLELPAGEQSLRVPFTAEGQGNALLLCTWLAPESRGTLFVGFRDLEILNGTDSPGPAPILRASRAGEVEVTPALADSLFGSITWRPRQLELRGASAGTSGLELSAGGEAWLHTDGMLGEVRGQLTRSSANGRAPFVRVVWYRGGRVQILQQYFVQDGQVADFHAWAPEPGGWIGVLVDAGEGVAPVVVRVTSNTLTP